MGTQPSRARRAKRQVFRAVLALVPTGAKLFVARRLFPNLVRYLRPGQEFLNPEYLGRFSVMIDPGYPVEIALLGNRFERGTIALIHSLVHDGHVCLDIGANVGALTIPLADRVGPGGKVYAFEPGPVPFARLRRNLALNPSLENRVVALQLGVADRPGRLHWQADEHGNPANATMFGSTGTPVDVVALDTYFAAAALHRLDFVKIDVEGMEYEVLVGGEATWRAHRPIIYFESELRFARMRGFPTLELIERFLRGIGYELYKVGQDQRLTAVTAATMAQSTLAVHASSAALRAGSRLPAPVSR